MIEEGTQAFFKVIVQIPLTDHTFRENIKQEIVNLTYGDEGSAEKLLTGDPEVIAMTPAQETAEIYCDLLRSKHIPCWVESG